MTLSPAIENAVCRIGFGCRWRIRALLAGARSLRNGVAIQAKWLRDKQRLPLTQEHKSLYRTIHLYFRETLGQWPDLVACRDYNEKIQWLKLFDQSETIVACVDKLRLREYVEQKLGAGHLPALYQIGARFDDLDLAALPNSFALKTNHDSGSVLLVRDKQRLDIASARSVFERALGRTFGMRMGEWAYALVPPKMFAEEYLEPISNVPPPDYKIHCVEGKARVVQYICDRGSNPKEQVLTREGAPAGYAIIEPYVRGNQFQKPEQWEEMLEIAETLSAGFKYVRIDLYLPGGHVYVGEMTFWPHCGCYPGQGQKMLGQELDFDRTSHKPPVYEAMLLANQRKPTRAVSA